MSQEENQKRTFSIRTKSLLQKSFSGSVLVNGDTKLKQDLVLPQISFKDKHSFISKSQCQLCFCPFKIGRLQHFCKICGLSVCSNCSTSTINKERYNKCYQELVIYVLIIFRTPQRQLAKQKIILDFKKIVKEIICQKDEAQAKEKSLEVQIPSQQMIKAQQQAHQKKIIQLNKKLQKVREQRITTQQRVKQLKNG